MRVLVAKKKKVSAGPWPQQSRMCIGRYDDTLDAPALRKAHLDTKASFQPPGGSKCLPPSP